MRNAINSKHSISLGELCIKGLIADVEVVVLRRYFVENVLGCL